MTDRRFEQISRGMFVDTEYAEALGRVGLTDIDAVFAFGGTDMPKDNMAPHRGRCCFTLDGPAVKVFMKRYDKPSAAAQIKSWLGHNKRACMADFDRLCCDELAKANICTPKVIAYGCQWAGLFERRSFIITEEIPGGEALERRLPGYFHNTPPYNPSSSLSDSPLADPSRENVRQRRQFIEALAEMARRFHDTGYRHRDFYLAHIFLDGSGEFNLIDLHRTFKPILLKGRYRVKDIAQLHYSAPGNIFSCADRIRFYRRYVGRKRLTSADRRFIGMVKRRAWRMADHDIRHGRDVPFAS